MKNTGGEKVEFYRSDFLHSFLPFEEILVWAANILTFMSLSMAAARHPMHGNKSGRPLIVLFIFSAAFFIRELGDYVANTVLITMSLVMILIEMYRLFRKEEAEDD